MRLGEQQLTPSHLYGRVAELPATKRGLKMKEAVMKFHPLQGHRVVLTHVRASGPTTSVPVEELEGLVRDLGGTVVHEIDVHPGEGMYVVVNDKELPWEMAAELEGEVMVLLLADWLDGVYTGIQADPVTRPLLERLLVDTAGSGAAVMSGIDLRRVLVLRQFANELNALTTGGEA